MPIYEYQCSECNEIEEAVQKMSDAPLETCRHCSGKLYKLISQSSFHLKGSGWYVTDYKGKQSGGKESPAKSESGGSVKSDSGGSEKSDSACSVKKEIAEPTSKSEKKKE